MNLQKRMTGVTINCAAMLLFSALPASAATNVIYDPSGDAVSGFDLTRTAFHNTPRRITVRARVVGLRLERTGVEFSFGPVSNPDLGFTAKTYLGRDGSRTTLQNLEVSREGPGPAPHVPCAVRAGWHVVEDFVFVSVPQSCIRNAAGPLNMHVSVVRPGTNVVVVDQTRWIQVQRG